jgi:hypothetical protein
VPSSPPQGNSCLALSDLLRLWLSLELLWSDGHENTVWFRRLMQWVLCVCTLVPMANHTWKN